LLSGAAVVWTCADALAAQKLPMVRIGFLATQKPPKECCPNSKCISLPREAYQTPACQYAWPVIDLLALGWREGDYRLDIRYADNDPTLLPRLAAELVALRPDILIANATSETKALQAATSDIPIVFMLSSDPVGMGIVDSLPHPGRNTTGTSIAPLVLWGKRLEIITELIGHLPSKIAWLCNPGNVATESNQAAIMQSAKQMNIQVERFEARAVGDIDRAFATMAGSEAVLVQFDALMDFHQQQINELAVRYRLPAIYDNRLHVVKGGLIAYGADMRDNYRYGAGYVDRILRGARPKDLPVYQSSLFHLVINLKAAQAIGLAVPPSLLARAHEFIE
jgi:putative ABC transport system substrate-binding protein